MSAVIYPLERRGGACHRDSMSQIQSDRLSEEGQWMTLKELADRRAITLASVARLVRRRRWRQQPGNDGQVRVFVPDSPVDSRQDALSVLRRAVDLLQGQIPAMEARAERAEERARKAEERAEALEREKAAREGQGRWARLMDAWRA